MKEVHYQVLDFEETPIRDYLNDMNRITFNHGSNNHEFLLFYTSLL